MKSNSHIDKIIMVAATTMRPTDPFPAPLSPALTMTTAVLPRPERETF